MALANKPGYWTETNKRQSDELSRYQKTGGKDKIRLRNMRADIKYSAGRAIAHDSMSKALETKK